MLRNRRKKGISHSPRLSAFIGRLYLLHREKKTKREIRKVGIPAVIAQERVGVGAQLR
jgi:hypothetical protein